MPPLLKVNNISKSYGALTVSDHVSFDVGSQEILGVVGPNGAGKTTLFGLISGDIAAYSGTIELEGSRIDHLGSARRTHSGLARTFQIPKPFTHMKVIDNLRVAATFGAKTPRSEVAALVAQTLEATHLTSVADLLAGALPLLARRRLELARALASRPKVLLVDEVAGGLTDPEVDEFIHLIKTIRESGVSIIWIEHVMRAMTAATDRLIALDQGRVIAEGEPAEVFEHEEVRRVYTGT